MNEQITRPCDSTANTGKNPDKRARIHRRIENLLTSVLTRGYNGRVSAEISVADGMIKVANVTCTETLK